MLPHKTQVSFDLRTKTKYFSTPTQKQGNSDPYSDLKSVSTPTHSKIKLNLLSPRHENQVNFDPDSMHT